MPEVAQVDHEQSWAVVQHDVHQLFPQSLGPRPPPALADGGNHASGLRHVRPDLQSPVGVEPVLVPDVRWRLADSGRQPCAQACHRLGEHAGDAHL
jgi:hypothetical protein